MRSKYLETDKYPFAKYQGKLSSVEKVSGEKYKVSVNGEMSIHGVTNRLPVEGTLIKN